MDLLSRWKNTAIKAPDVLVFHLGSNAEAVSHVLQNRDIPSKLRLFHLNDRMMYQLTGVVFHENYSHFKSWLLLSAQDRKVHYFPTLFPGQQSSFIGNGIWQVDSLKASELRFKNVLDSSKLAQALKKNNTVILNEEVEPSSSAAGQSFRSSRLKTSTSYPAVLVFTCNGLDISEATESEMYDSVFAKELSTVLSHRRRESIGIQLSLPRDAGQNFCFVNSVIMALYATLPLQQLSPSPLSKLLNALRDKTSSFQTLASLRATFLRKRAAISASRSMNEPLDLSGKKQEDAKEFFNLVQNECLQGNICMFCSCLCYVGIDVWL